MGVEYETNSSEESNLLNLKNCDIELGLATSNSLKNQLLPVDLALSKIEIKVKEFLESLKK